MASYSNFQAVYGLQATATATSTNTTGSLAVGQTPTVESLAGADAAYSFSITSATTNGQAVWTLATGSCAAVSSGTTVADGDGKDAEGQTFPTFDGVYGYLITYASTFGGDVYMTASSARFDLPSITIPNGVRLMHFSDGGFGTSGIVTFQFSKPNETIKIVAIAGT